MPSKSLLAPFPNPQHPLPQSEYLTLTTTHITITNPSAPLSEDRSIFICTPRSLRACAAHLIKLNAKLDKTNQAFANTWRNIHDIDSKESRANQERKARRRYSRVVYELEGLNWHRRRPGLRYGATQDAAPGQRIKAEARKLKGNRDAEDDSTNPYGASEPHNTSTGSPLTAVLNTPPHANHRAAPRNRGSQNRDASLPRRGQGMDKRDKKACYRGFNMGMDETTARWTDTTRLRRGDLSKGVGWGSKTCMGSWRQ